MTLWKTLSIAASMLCLAPPNLMAQEPAPRAHAEVQLAPKDVQTAVFVLQHADAKAVAKLLADFTEYMGGSIKANGDGHSLAVVGTKELVAAVGEALKRLDTDQAAKADRPVELTFHLLWLTKNGQIDAELPSELKGVAAQLKQVYRGVRLVGTSVIRTTEGKHNRIQGVGDLPGDVNVTKIGYEVNFGELRLIYGSDAKTWMIQLAVSLRAQLRVETAKWETFELSSCLAIHGTQPVAVASTNTGVDGASLCLVVSAKVVD